MTFSDEDIKSLHLSKGYNASRLLAEFPDKGWTKRSINRLFQKQQMLPVMRRIAEDLFMSQQDSATAHRARETVQLLQQQTPEFISPDLWLSNSPDLNPVDYRIWGLMRERVYKTAVPDISQLKQRLIDTWSNLSQDVVDDAIDQWRVRLQACVKAKGRHFEYLL